MSASKGGRLVTGLVYDEEAECWRATGGERVAHGRTGSSVKHEWTDEERLLVVLTMNPETGGADRDMQKRVIAVLPKDVPIASVYLVRANLRGALGFKGGFQNPDDKVLVLAKRGLERLRSEAEAELLRRENQ